MSGFLDLISLLNPSFGRTTLSQAEIDQRITPPGPNVKGFNSVIYPSDLFTPGNEPYVLFYVRDSVARGAAVKASMALYMPPTIKVRYGAQYNEIEMTLLQYEDLAKGLGIDAGLLSSGTSEQRQQVLEGLAKGGMVGAGKFLDYFAGTGTIGQQILQQQQRTVNPHMALLFKGVDFRSFSFTFQMMARNPEESEAIQKIIQTFKLGMHPEEGGDGENRYWLYPDNFDIFLFSPKKEYLFNISTCVLTEMNVDYAKSGVPSFFKDTGAPVDLEMTLTFRELEIMTKKRIKENF